MSGSGKLLAPVHTSSRFWPDLGNSEVIHWTKNALSLEVIDLTSQFEETAPGLSANRKCALSSALVRRVKAPLALKGGAQYQKAGLIASLAEKPLAVLGR